MAQIISIQRDTKGKFKYERSYVEIGKTILEVTNNKLSIVLDFFERVLYNFLINNGDYHLKNISLRHNEHSQSSIYYDALTPNYDSVYTRCYFKDEYVFAIDLLDSDEFTESYLKLG